MPTKEMKYKSSPFLTISSEIDGHEACAFCDKPSTGHLITEFGKSFSNYLKGLAISVCESCEEHRREKLATGFESNVE